jgi:hypothetical protein
VTTVVDRVVAAHQTHDVEALGWCYAPAATVWPTGWAASAPAQEWLAAVPLIIERFPDLAFARGRSVTSGDLTMVELRMTGTEESGEHLLADGVVVFVVRDDLVVEERHYWLYADVPAAVTA